LFVSIHLKRIGPSDMIILAGFLKEKITFVHARDKGIEATCGELGLNLIPTPVRDIEKEKKLRAKVSKH
jgi:hypothetical protein